MTGENMKFVMTGTRASSGTVKNDLCNTDPNCKSQARLEKRCIFSLETRRSSCQSQAEVENAVSSALEVKQVLAYPEASVSHDLLMGPSAEKRRTKDAKEQISFASQVILQWRY